MAIFAKAETQARRAVKFVIKHSSHRFTSKEIMILNNTFVSLTTFIKDNRLSSDGLRGVNDNILSAYLNDQSDITKGELQQQKSAIETYISLKKKVYSE